MKERHDSCLLGTLPGAFTHHHSLLLRARVGSDVLSQHVPSVRILGDWRCPRARRRRRSGAPGWAIGRRHARRAHACASQTCSPRQPSTAPRDLGTPTARPEARSGRMRSRRENATRAAAETDRRGRRKAVRLRRGVPVPSRARRHPQARGHSPKRSSARPRSGGTHGRF